MNREILFRGFHECENGDTVIKVNGKEKRGEWVEGYLFQIWDEVYILWGTTNGIPDMIKIIPSTVGQFAGLTDKNDKRIFENDIVKKGFEKFKVFWNQTQCKFDLYDFDGNVIAGFNEETSVFLELIGDDGNA